MIREHHKGYISYDKYLENRKRLRDNLMMPNSGTNGPKGAAREGPALLQGLVRCGQCGRPMSISYGRHRRGGSHRVYQYRCCAKRGWLAAQDCQLIGCKRIDQTVAQAFLEATKPAALEAAREANQLVRQENEQMARYWRHQVEKALLTSPKSSWSWRKKRRGPRLSARILGQRDS